MIDGYKSALHVRSSNPWRESGSAQLVQQGVTHQSVPSYQQSATGPNATARMGENLSREVLHPSSTTAGSSTWRQPGAVGPSSTAAGNTCAQSIESQLVQQFQQAQQPCTSAAPRALPRHVPAAMRPLGAFNEQPGSQQHHFCQQGHGSRLLAGGGSSHGIPQQPPQHAQQQHSATHQQERHSSAVHASTQHPLPTLSHPPTPQHGVNVRPTQTPHMMCSHNMTGCQNMQQPHHPIQQQVHSQPYPQPHQQLGQRPLQQASHNGMQTQHMLHQHHYQMPPQQQQFQLQHQFQRHHQQQGAPILPMNSGARNHSVSAVHSNANSHFPVRRPSGFCNASATANAPPAQAQGVAGATTAGLTANFTPSAGAQSAHPQQNTAALKPPSHSAPARMASSVPTRAPPSHSAPQLHFTTATNSSSSHPSFNNTQHPSMHGAPFRHSQPHAPSSAQNLLSAMHAPRAPGRPAQHAAAHPPQHPQHGAQHTHFNAQHAQRSHNVQYHSLRPMAVPPASMVQPGSERPYDTCPGVFKHCGGELHLLRQHDGPEMWVCRACGHMCCGVAQENDVKLSLELIETVVQSSTGVSATVRTEGKGPTGTAMPSQVDCGGQNTPEASEGRHEVAAGTTEMAVCELETSRDAKKVVQVAVRPLLQCRQAVRNEGGVLNAICRRQGHAVTSALHSILEEAVFPFELLPTLREVLKRYNLLDPRQSDVPEWIEKSFRRDVPRASATEVDEVLSRMPQTLKKGLMPFQWEGVQFGLQCTARCLIGDEMGVGKTVQAIALAACHMHLWSPLLVICPASLRLLWCEELEKWLPGLRPCDITVVQGSADWHPETMQTVFSATEAHAPQPDTATCAVLTSGKAPCMKHTDAAENGRCAAQPNLPHKLANSTCNKETDQHSLLQQAPCTAQAVPGNSANDGHCCEHAQSSSGLCEWIRVTANPTGRSEVAASHDTEAKLPQQSEAAIDLVDSPSDTSMHVLEAKHDTAEVLNDQCVSDSVVQQEQGAEHPSYDAAASQQQTEPQPAGVSASQKEALHTGDGSQQHASQGDQDANSQKAGEKAPKVIIISYHMAANLSCAACKFPITPDQNSKSSSAKGSKGTPAVQCTGFPHCVAAGVFRFVIVDESHHMRTQSGPIDNQMTEVAKQIVRKSNHAVLLSGTPSVTRPFDLAGQLYCLRPDLTATDGGFGGFKTSFAFRYCQRRLIRARRRGGGSGPQVWWQGGAERLGELASVLRRDFMIRRLKIDVLPQLPAKRRQVVRLEKPSRKDYADAEQTAWQAWQDEQNDEERARLEIDGAFQLPEASMEGNHQEVTDGNSSDEDASESDWNSVGQGARQQRLFRMRGTPKQSPEDARPVTTHQHILGLAKVRQVKEFLSTIMLPAVSGDNAQSSQSTQASMDNPPPNVAASGPKQKVILFAHHKSVMNQLQIMLEDHFQVPKTNAPGASPPPLMRNVDFLTNHQHRVCVGVLPYMRIDGTTDHRSRQELQKRFHDDPTCNVALLSMNATAVGLDFSCATAVVFAEVPDTADILLQAEGRAHRLTSKSAVNVYMLLCKASSDVRTWCRLAESLEQQAPLLDTGRKSQAAAEDLTCEAGDQGTQHACSSGGGQGAGGVSGRHGYVGDEVKAARAVTAADASGRARPARGDAGEKKALHVDDVVDLSVAVQQQRAAACAQGPLVSTLGAASSLCSSGNWEDSEGGCERGSMGVSAEKTVKAAAGQSQATCVAQVVHEHSQHGENGAGVCADVDAAHLDATRSAQELDGIGTGATDSQVAASVDLQADEPPCDSSQAAVASLQQDIHSQQAGDASAAVGTQCPAEAQPESRLPVSDSIVAADLSVREQDIADCVPVDDTTDPVCATIHSDEDILVPDTAARGAVEESTDAHNIVECSAAAAVLPGAGNRKDEQVAAVSSGCQEAPLADNTVAFVPDSHPDNGAEAHANHSCMHDDLPDWLTESLPDQSDLKQEEHVDMKDSCVLPKASELESWSCDPKEEQLQQASQGSKGVAAAECDSKFDASRVFFMVNQHTENVTLLLGEEGCVPLGLRLPLSALQPKAAGETEKHVEHLQTLLKPISVADCSEGQPVARLPWGGMVCPVVPMCAAALEATMRRAVAFGVSWSALSAMERHQLVNRVLDVGDAAGVSPVHSCDSQAGTTSQQEAEESFLRNIDKRNVRIKVDPAKGEHWRPVAVTVPTSRGAKRMAFDQPFTCTNKQHLCLSAPHRCCAGKRHCCNCKKILASSANMSASASGSGTATGPTNTISCGHGSMKAKGGSTGKRKVEAAAPKRTQKRLFASLVAGTETSKEPERRDSGGDDDVCVVGERPSEGGWGGEGAAGCSAAAVHTSSQVEPPGSTEGHVQQEVEDVASMLLLFCSARCQNDYMLLKSNSAIRRQLFAIERGRCTECSLDTEGLLTRLRCLPGSFLGIERRLQTIFTTAPSWSRNQKRKDAARRLAKYPVPGNAWQADHIKAVHLGGGLCDISNFRTLCTCCHADVTAKQARDRAKHADAGNTRGIPEMFEAALGNGARTGGAPTQQAKRKAAAKAKDTSQKKPRNLAEFFRK